MAPQKPKRNRPAAAPAPDEGAGPKKRNVIYITLDEETEARLQRFLETHRIKPDRAAVGLTAILEFLDREEKRQATRAAE